MKIVAPSFAILLLFGGCATVSMVPTTAVVETEIAAEQSRLRTVSDAYVEQAKSQNWIVDGSGFWSIAKVLVDGAESDPAKPTLTQYEQRLLDAGPVVSDRAELIKADALSAARGLDLVTKEAQSLIGAQIEAKNLRADILSFETALITAQQSRRTFIRAIGTLPLSNEDADKAISLLEASIDQAKSAADLLSKAHLIEDSAQS